MLSAKTARVMANAAIRILSERSEGGFIAEVEREIRRAAAKGQLSVSIRYAEGTSRETLKEIEDVLKNKGYAVGYKNFHMYIGWIV